VPLIAVALLIAVIAVAAVLVLRHHHSSNTGAASVSRTHSTSSRGTTTKERGSKRAVTVDPRTVTVAVLNGTTTSNLAADVSQKLGRVGFKQGKTTNFTTQSLTTTTVGYEPGHRAQALAVAKALKVKYAHVLRVNPATRQLICPATSSCADQVFVVLGSDLASDA
jgi:LytR cell envelope-related transcriptional attenuator